MTSWRFAVLVSSVAVLSFCLSTSGAAAARRQMLQTLQSTAMDASDGSRLAHVQRKLLQELALPDGSRKSLLQDVDLAEDLSLSLEEGDLDEEEEEMVDSTIHSDYHRWLTARSDESLKHEESIASGLSRNGRILNGGSDPSGSSSRASLGARIKTAARALLQALDDISSLSFGGEEGSVLDLEAALEDPGSMDSLLASFLSDTAAQYWSNAAGNGPYVEPERLDSNPVAAAVRHGYVATTF